MSTHNIEHCLVFFILCTKTLKDRLIYQVGRYTSFHKFLTEHTKFALSCICLFISYSSITKYNEEGSCLCTCLYTQDKMILYSKKLQICWNLTQFPSCREFAMFTNDQTSRKRKEKKTEIKNMEI